LIPNVTWIGHGKNVARDGSGLPIKGRLAGVMLLLADEVFYLVTAEEYQRRGVATALLAYAKKTHQLLTTKKKPSNRRTLALLEREGFRFVDEDSDWRRT
jgi:GNAT superfamily N-acetyltransferase